MDALPPKTPANSKVGLCRHCRQPVPASLGDFCCAGCEAVYSAVHELGLEEFYARRGIDDQAKIVPPRNRSYSYLDDPHYLATLTQPLEGGRFSATLLLEGMHCTGCVWLLEHLPKKVPGLEAIRVDFSGGKITIIYHPDQVSLTHIARTLDALGYPAHPPTSRGQVERLRIGHRRALFRLGITAFCAMNTMMLAVSLWQGMSSGIPGHIGSYFRWVSLAVSLPAVTYGAWPIYQRAIAALLLRRFHIDLPLTLAIIGTFLLSGWNTLIDREQVYFDSVTALVFLLLMSRFVHQRATERAQRATQESWQILPLRARRVKPTEDEVPSEDLAAGDLVEIGAGERFPCDGTVTSGSSAVDRSTLTGEPLPIPVERGSSVEAGTKNLSAPLLVEVRAAGSRSRVGRILEELQHSNSDRAALSSFTDRAAAWFTYAVLALSTITFFLWRSTDLFRAIDNALALLIVTCPCALGLATPLIFAAAQAQAARRGLLLKGLDTIERLAQVRTAFFDKTGTLTKGTLTVQDEVSIANDAAILNQLRGYACQLAAASPSHPVAAAVLSAFGRIQEQRPTLSSTELITGRGCQGRDSEGIVWKLGSQGWCAHDPSSLPPQITSALNRWESQALSPLLLTRNSEVVWAIALADQLEPTAATTLQMLSERGIQSAILSGDVLANVEAAARELATPGLTAHAELTPEAKAQIVASSSDRSAMIGDGVNDALAMKRASVAIGIKGGIDGNLEVADVIVLRGGIQAVGALFQGAIRTLQVIRYTLIVSLLYNIAGAALAMSGHLTPLIAAFVMPLSSLSVLAIAVWSRPFHDRSR